MKYLIPAVLTLAILFARQALSTHEEVELVEVVDGDTADMENDTVRFIGVDTPEISSENNPVEYGLENSTETRECPNRYRGRCLKLCEKPYIEKSRPCQ